MIANFFEGAFAVDFLFQPAQRLVHGLAFFKSDFGQLYSLPLRVQSKRFAAFIARTGLMRGARVAARKWVSTGKKGRNIKRVHLDTVANLGA